MKATYLLDSRMHVGDVPEPVPRKGQVLVRTHSCGICASDHHWLHAGRQIVEFSRECGGIYADIDLARPIVPGHEFNGEIVGYGPGTSRRMKVGTRVTSSPRINRAAGLQIVGHSNDFPGGFGEYMVLEEELLKEIPAAVDPDFAAMAEPLSVGMRHARTGAVGKDEASVVVGCGAIGLAVIAGLKLFGAGPIIAADYAPSRRALALEMGADVAVDPRQKNPYGLQPALKSRAANVIFECAGKSGVLNGIINKAAPNSRIIVAGYCWENDQIFTPGASMKRLTVVFGDRSQADDMGEAVTAICDGKVDVSKWIGDRVGLAGVAGALDCMGNPEAPIRTVIHPQHIE